MNLKRRNGDGANGRFDFVAGSPVRPFARSLAFTLVELLTVLIIITILIGILIPTISHVRRAAYNAGVQAQIATLRQAIDQYYADFHAYPGPVSNAVMGTNVATADPNYINYATDVTQGSATNLVEFLTGPENLVLGLIGGLQYQPNSTPAGMYYDCNLVGQGAYSLNTGLPKKFGTYIDTGDLSPTFNSTHSGLYSEPGVPSIDDSPVPEILDRFPSRMPILYLRANVGATMYNSSGTFGDDNNPVVIDASSSSYGGDTGGQTSPVNTSANPVIRYAQYDISQIKAYTQSYGGASIGEGKTAVQNSGTGTTPYTHGLQTVGSADVLTPGSANYVYPYPAYPYFTDPNSPAYSKGPPLTLPYARAKDTYILISAGIDRIYGTADDITSFGDVRP